MYSLKNIFAKKIMSNRKREEKKKEKTSKGKDFLPLDMTKNNY